MSYKGSKWRDREDKGPRKIVTVVLPEDLYNSYRSFCMAQGVSMSKKAAEIIAIFVNQKEVGK